MADSEGSKRFPFISLEKAMARAKQLFDADTRGNEMTTGGAFEVWGYSGKSSGGFQTVGALRAYGLIIGGDSGKIKLSRAAWDFFRDERDDVRAKAIKIFALTPPLLKSLWAVWGDKPPADMLARSYLKLERGLHEQQARAVLGIYKDNLAFADLKGDAKISEDGTSGSRESAGDRSSIKVGDYVQWASNGVDQFHSPMPVEWISEDGSHLRVVGSMTGVPMSEARVDTQANPRPTTSASALSEPMQPHVAGKDRLIDNNEISVALIGNRLRITADVDGAGLEKLESAIGKFKDILRMLQ